MVRSSDMVAHAAHIKLEQIDRVVACMQDLCDDVTHEQAAEALKPCHVDSSPFVDPVTSAIVWLRRGGKMKRRQNSNRRPANVMDDDITTCKVIVKTLCGRSVTLTIDRDGSVDNLRSQIQEQGFMHSSRQQTTHKYTFALRTYKFLTPLRVDRIQLI
jgi:hypothetical protein